MFAKLLVILIATFCIALALLSLRQTRIDTVHDMTRVHRDTMVQRRMIWSVRHRLAGLLQAEQLQTLIGTEREWSTLERPHMILSTKAAGDERD